MVYQLQKHGFNPIPSYDTVSKKIVINWDAKDPNLGNRIEELFYKSVITVNVNLTEFKFSDLKITQAGNEISNFKINNKLLSINCFPHKGTLEINVDGLATGVEPSLNLSGLVVYKHPFSNTTILKFNDGTDQYLNTTILDISGRAIEHKKWHTINPLEIGSDLKPGVYLLKLVKNNQSTVIKIIQ